MMQQELHPILWEIVQQELGDSGPRHECESLVGMQDQLTQRLAERAELGRGIIYYRSR
jgi:hypothetical protein